MAGIESRVAIITGGATGVGSATALMLAARGWPRAGALIWGMTATANRPHPGAAFFNSASRPPITEVHDIRRRLF